MEMRLPLVYFFATKILLFVLVLCKPYLLGSLPVNLLQDAANTWCADLCTVSPPALEHFQPAASLSTVLRCLYIGLCNMVHVITTHMCRHSCSQIVLQGLVFAP